MMRYMPMLAGLFSTLEELSRLLLNTLGIHFFAAFVMNKIILVRFLFAYVEKQ